MFNQTTCSSMLDKTSMVHVYMYYFERDLVTTVLLKTCTCLFVFQLAITPDESKRTRCKSEIQSDTNSPLYDEKFSLWVWQILILASTYYRLNTQWQQNSTIQTTPYQQTKKFTMECTASYSWRKAKMSSPIWCITSVTWLVFSELLEEDVDKRLNVSVWNRISNKG